MRSSKRKRRAPLDSWYCLSGGSVTTWYKIPLDRLRHATGFESTFSKTLNAVLCANVLTSIMKIVRKRACQMQTSRKVNLLETNGAVWTDNLKRIERTQAREAASGLLELSAQN